LIDQPVLCSMSLGDGEGGEHDGEVGFDRFAFVVVDRSGLQVVLGHAEAFLDAPRLVVGVDHELGRRPVDVGDVALPAGQRAALASSSRFTLLSARPG
jgi:hypothetical protein